MDPSEHRALWERRQAELWDRIFQVTQDVAHLSDTIEDSSGGSVMKQGLVNAAMNVGKHVVRATAAESGHDFTKHLDEARMQAIEADYWLRLTYIIQQQEGVQRDVSNIIAQYASIIDLLKKMVSHVERQHDASAHMERPKISL
jgi:four helix bundle protein